MNKYTNENNIISTYRTLQKSEKKTNLKPEISNDVNKFNICIYTSYTSLLPYKIGFTSK